MLSKLVFKQITYVYLCFCGEEAGADIFIFRSWLEMSWIADNWLIIHNFNRLTNQRAGKVLRHEKVLRHRVASLKVLNWSDFLILPLPDFAKGCRLFNSLWGFGKLLRDMNSDENLTNKDIMYYVRRGALSFPRFLFSLIDTVSRRSTISSDRTRLTFELARWPWQPVRFFENNSEIHDICWGIMNTYFLILWILPSGFWGNLRQNWRFVLSTMCANDMNFCVSTWP